MTPGGAFGGGPPRSAPHRADGETDVESREAFAARRERHIGRMQAAVEALAISSLVTARLSSVRRPGEGASADEWRRFGEATLGALDEFSARMGQFACQISEETSLMRQDLRCARREPDGFRRNRSER